MDVFETIFPFWEKRVVKLEKSDVIMDTNINNYLAFRFKKQ